MSERIEHCNCCDAATGRAGVHDDSLFRASEGPFCEDCYESWPKEIINQRDALAADNKRLREALEAFDSAAKSSTTIIGFAGKAMGLLKQARGALAGSKEGEL